MPFYKSYTAELQGHLWCFYPGGRGPFIGVTLGVVGVRVAEEEVPGLWPLVICREPAAAAAAAPSSSGWFEHPLADAWEEPSDAGHSLSSLGEELLEEAGERNDEDDMKKKNRCNFILNVVITRSAHNAAYLNYWNDRHVVLLICQIRF